MIHARHAGRRATHGSAPWLALFAMFMLFAGPLFSQGLAIARAQQGGAAMDCHQGMSKATAEHTDHGLWERCGYCSLLFDHPATTPTPPLLPTSRLQPTAEPSVALASPCLSPPYSDARPRAPPPA